MDGGVDGDYEDFTEYSERATAHAAGLLFIVSAFLDCIHCFTSPLSDSIFFPCKLRDILTDFSDLAV